VSKAEWQDIEGVLAAVMDLPPAERSARIAQLCCDRPELQAEVESLLEAHEKAASFLDVETLVDSSVAASFSLEGKQFGAYRLLAVLGTGGMGTVYHAERADGRFQQQVAIKVVPAATAASCSFSNCCGTETGTFRSANRITPKRAATGAARHRKRRTRIGRRLTAEVSTGGSR
jgi:hypothetical protein